MNEIKQFLEERPSINVASFAREAGCSRQMIDYIVNGKYKASPRLMRDLLPVMIKYGWKP
jgi:hypothetical protein